MLSSIFFFFNDTATTEIYTLSLHDALPISRHVNLFSTFPQRSSQQQALYFLKKRVDCCADCSASAGRDRKSTRLNSSHGYISYAVFCLKKKKNDIPSYTHTNKVIWYSLTTL